MFVLDISQLIHLSVDIPNMASFVAAMLMLARLLKQPAR